MKIVTRKPYSVLITDDDEGLRDSLQAVVERRGYRTYLAGSGDEALRIFRREYIDVAILDMHLPGMTGLATWQTYRDEIDRVLPCVFMTGDIQYVAHLKGIGEPACDVLTKPLTTERVIAALESMIRRFVDRGRSQIPE